jgi:hypothetical protein
VFAYLIEPPPNYCASFRLREHLTEAEIEKLLAATWRNRYGDRDAGLSVARPDQVQWVRHSCRSSDHMSLTWFIAHYCPSIRLVFL